MFEEKNTAFFRLFPGIFFTGLLTGTIFPGLFAITKPLPTFDDFIKKTHISTNSYYIKASVLVTANQVAKDGITVLETSATTAADFLDTAYRELAMDYPKFFKMDKLSKLGMLAADMLLKNEPLQEVYQPEQVGIVLANANASLDADQKYMDSVKNIPSPALFVYTLPNIVIGEISIRYGLKGENAFFIQPVFDAEWLYFYTQDLLQHNRVQACICGWADVVDNAYKALFLLVEKGGGDNATPFTAATIKELYS